MCAPKAPNPTTTAAAQTASNRDTAITQAGLNAINQVTPNGNLTYTQNGTWSDGTPKFTATQTLSPAGQALQGTTQQTQQNLANVAQEQSGRLSGLLNAPNDWSQQQEYLNNLTNSNLDPSWDRQAQQFETQLINRGIRPGSDAYREQIGDFSMNRSNAYNAANLSNFTTAQQSQAALRAQPLNEILALAGGTQIQSPQFTSTPQTSVGGTDVAGITNGAFNAQMQNYNANQGVLGGLFSAGANLFLSDRRAKKNISRIGTTSNGLPWYSFLYLTDSDGAPLREGLMSDDVRSFRHEAVITGGSGYDMIDYQKALA